MTIALLQRCAVTIGLLASLSVATLEADSPACLGAHGMTNLGTVDSQTGVRTVTVTVPSSLNQGTKDAIDAAFSAWNAQTSTTKVHFTKVGSGGNISITVNDTLIASHNSNCGYSFSGGNVYIESAVNGLGANPTSSTSGHTNSSIITYLVTHEFGHVLNLDQTTNAGSIMDGLGSDTDCLSAIGSGYPSTTTIQGSDATAAKDCANRYDDVIDSGGGAGASQPNRDCWDVYWVNIWYTFDGDEFVVDGYEWDYLYTTCDSNPYPD